MSEAQRAQMLKVLGVTGEDDLAQTLQLLEGYNSLFVVPEDTFGRFANYLSRP